MECIGWLKSISCERKKEKIYIVFSHKKSRKKNISVILKFWVGRGHKSNHWICLALGFFFYKQKPIHYTLIIWFPGESVSVLSLLALKSSTQKKYGFSEKAEISIFLNNFKILFYPWIVLWGPLYIILIIDLLWLHYEWMLILKYQNLFNRKTPPPYETQVQKRIKNDWLCANNRVCSTIPFSILHWCHVNSSIFFFFLWVFYFFAPNLEGVK